jgi:hypothetical protein
MLTPFFFELRAQKKQGVKRGFKVFCKPIITQIDTWYKFLKARLVPCPLCLVPL